MNDARPLVEGVLELLPDGAIRLIHTRCEACGALAFPARERCARCSSERLARAPAPDEGRLYTWTVVGSNHVVGRVDLAPGLRIQSIIRADPAQLAIDAPLRLVPLPAGQDDEGRALVGYAFAPLAATP